MTRNELFSSRLRSLRIEREAQDQRRWTAEDVGKSLGMSQSTFSNYENGLRIPSLDVIERIAKFYKVSPAYISGFSDYKGNTDSDALLVLPTMTEHAKTMFANPLGDYGVSEEVLTRYGLSRSDILIDVVQDNSMAPLLLKDDVVILRRDVNPTQHVPHGLYCVRSPDGKTWLRWVKQELDGSVKVYPENSTHFESFTFNSEDFAHYTILGSIFKIIREPKTDVI
ncbi:LexA family transcriptional regulator [Vibrio furnissii]|uniref:LexA family transcriptional regulator n=1 Tax=Vibrio furnissii TaxID=29494 RepID=UPI001EECDC4F|nr:LexA family transcriptional regulator [Vibrio furnissii]MCG6216248.1 LexA family transcriptional regulator [Vibrio furnissii]